MSNLRRLSLFERLTWRFSLLSVKEWLVLAAALIGLILFGVFTVNRSGACSGDQLHMQLALDQSDRDIRALSRTDQAGRCSAYNHRRDLLTEASDLMRRCGTGRSGRGSSEFLTGHDGEIGLYTTLVEKNCGDAKRQ